MITRRLAVADLAQSRELAAEAFGGWPHGQTPPPLPTELPTGRFEWGTFDGDRLVAKVATHPYESWFGGRRVPTTGVAGVAVASEQRGGGLLSGLFEVAVTEGLERGEVLSTLYPTAPGIYRSLGYELVTSLDTVEVPVGELARIRPPAGITTRRATADDVPAVAELYAAWAAAQNGPLTRAGVRFEGKPGVLEELTAITLAIDATGVVVGYLAWDRGTGKGPGVVLTVEDLLATSADAYRALWSVAASFASVVEKVRLRTSGDDPARLVLPGMTWDVTERHPYMLRVLDLPGAVAAMSPALPGGGTAAVDLVVTGDRLGHLDGGYRLLLGDGPATCEQTEPAPGAATMTTQGLALLVAGAQSCANLRLLAHLSGAAEGDRVLDAAFGGRQVHVRDYF